MRLTVDVLEHRRDRRRRQLERATADVGGEVGRLLVRAVEEALPDALLLEEDPEAADGTRPTRPSGTSTSTRS
jgi:hypothetical protein